MIHRHTQVLCVQQLIFVKNKDFASDTMQALLIPNQKRCNLFIRD